MLPMPKPRPRHLHRETTRHGKTVWYYRRGTGPRTRIEGEYGSAEFMAAYDRADRGDRIEKPITASKGTVKWLIERYMDSSAFNQELASGTQKARRAIFKQIIAKAGDAKLAHVDRQTIVDGREARKDKPHAANNYLRAVKGLFKWATEAGLIDADPTLGIGKIKAKSTPHKDWPHEYVMLYLDKYPVGTRERLAFDLLLYTGMSRDITKLMRSHIRDGFFEMNRSKTGIGAVIWICPALQASMDAYPSGELFILPSARGGYWSAASFGNHFAEWCTAAGIPRGFTPHGLRRAGATLAAENGATHAELMAMFGWTKDEMASHYIRAASKRGLARGAGERIAKGMK